MNHYTYQVVTPLYNTGDPYSRIVETHHVYLPYIEIPYVCNKCEKDLNDSEYYRSNGEILNVSLCNGHIGCMKNALNNGHSVEKIKSDNIIGYKNGKMYSHKECIKFLQKLGVSWNGEYLCFKAAHFGDIELLKYMHENNPGHAWNKRHCDNTAAQKNYECLKYSVEQCAPLPKTIEESLYSASYGDRKCIKYMYDLGVPYHKETIEQLKLDE